MPRIWGRGCTLPLRGISGSTYAMKLKLTPGMTLDKISWLIWWQHKPCYLTHVYFTDQKPFCWHQQKVIDNVINQLLWSRKLPRVSFNLIACLEPVKQDDHFFHAEILVRKFRLRSREACLRMQGRFASPDFFMPKCSQGNFGFRSYLKKSPERGRCTPLRKQTNK